MKTILKLLLVLGFVSYEVRPEDSKETINEIGKERIEFLKKNTFHLKTSYAEIKNGKVSEVEGHGTAFLVTAEGYGNFVITASHCVQASKRPKIFNEFESLDVTIVFEDKEQDFAILKFKEIEKRNPPPLVSTDLKVGDTLFFCHYPRGVGPIFSKGSLLMIKPGSINYFASAEKFYSGSSGGYVSDEKNRAVGVCLAGLADEYGMIEGKCFFLPAKRIFQAISELRPIFKNL